MSAVSSETQFPLTTLRIAPCGDNNLTSFYDKPLGRHADRFLDSDKLVAGDYHKIVRAAAEAGIERVLIWGSEPLLRKDISSVTKSICSCKKLREVRFITNGIFLKDYAEGLRRAGVKHIEINFDSLNFMVYQKITRRDNLYRVLDGLQKVRRMDFDRLIVNVILLRGVNDSEIIDFAILTKEKQMHIQFLEYNPVAADTSLTRQLHYPAHLAKKRIEEFQPLDHFHNGDMDCYSFRSGKGVLSFNALRDSYLSYNQPMISLNSQGVLSANVSGSRRYNLVKELEKDHCEEKLQRLFAKLMQPAAPKQTGKKPTKTTKTTKTSKTTKATTTTTKTTSQSTARGTSSSGGHSPATA